MVQTICSLLFSAGVCFQREAKFLLPGKERMDIVVEPTPGLCARATMLDVTIRTAQRSGEEKQGEAIIAGISSKNAKYKEEAEAAGFDFLPLVWDTTGESSLETKAYINKLISRIPNSEEYYKPFNSKASTPVYYWEQRISMALHRGTARQVLQLIDKARNKAMSMPSMRPLRHLP